MKNKLRFIILPLTALIVLCMAFSGCSQCPEEHRKTSIEVFNPQTGEAVSMFGVMTCSYTGKPIAPVLKVRILCNGKYIQQSYLQVFGVFYSVYRYPGGPDMNNAPQTERGTYSVTVVFHPIDNTYLQTSFEYTLIIE